MAYENVNEYLTTLEETPRRLATVAAGLANSQPAHSGGQREWSPVEILAHLRACAEIWGHSIYAMIGHEEPALPPLSARRWAKTLGYTRLDYSCSLQVFSLQRAELLRVLRQLSPEGWLRTAAIDGHKHSVFSQARRMALHELEHRAQIEKFRA